MAISGHEEEFRRMFAQEAEGRLARLGQQLLELEASGPDQQQLIASIFREAHTLKGAAAVVGIDEVVQVAQGMEDVLERLRSGEQLVSPDLIDAVLATVDRLVEMIPAILSGEDRSLAGDAPQPRPARADPETIGVPVGRLDELVRLVGESATTHLRVGEMLATRLAVDPASVSEYRDQSLVLNDLQNCTMRARMVPVATITDQLHRAVRDLARTQGKQVRWEVRGDETELDRNVLQHLADPLLHLVRNAVDHGIESPEDRAAAGKPPEATVRLHAMQLGSEVIVAITDDGRGIDVAAVRQQAARGGADVSRLTDEEALYTVFRTGLSTAQFITDVSGRGVGLDVVKTSIDAVRGRIEVSSEPGAGCEFRIIVPITLAVLPCVLVAAAGQRYAIPMHSVILAQLASPGTETHAEGQPVVWTGKEPVALSSLARTLGTANTAVESTKPVVVLAGLTRKHAFRVDALLGQRDVVVKSLGQLLPRLHILAGASVEPDGSILLVLDAHGLIDRARLFRSQVGARPDQDRDRPRLASILVVDDALTVREIERSILERAGYEVRTAGDGGEALARLAERPADLVLTDVEMPHMDGFTLTEAIRANPGLADLPVLVLTSRASDEDRRRGLEAGADGYIVKSAFDEGGLLGAVQRLLGRRA